MDLHGASLGVSWISTRTQMRNDGMEWHRDLAIVIFIPASWRHANIYDFLSCFTKQGGFWQTVS